MKKIFNFKKKKGFPSSSETGSVLSASYDAKEKDLRKVHKAALRGDVVKVRQLAKNYDLNQLDKEKRTFTEPVSPAKPSTPTHLSQLLQSAAIREDSTKPLN
ncbi:ankyrin repeat domain-containing protein 7-like [Carassius gibelio]|uniref:ankyrin repeat domain-containing protein 7-like n=1 Tax=Carassius gibelio TaxID=101364 RepID=UPI00227965FB|nr:ankyrin repeat domain-containing protein 7-like [Carassius gibelio]